MKTLFLDFDGVLHTLSEAHSTPFSRLHLLHRVVIGNPVHIVVSSSWRFHYSWREIKAHMGILAPSLVGTTGPVATGKHARPPMATSNSPTFGRSNSSRQGGLIMQFVEPVV